MKKNNYILLKIKAYYNINQVMGTKFKKITALILTIIFVYITNIQFACCASMSGHIQKDETIDKNLDKKLFTGEIEHLDEKDTINLTVSQVLSSGYTLEGDEFFAEVTSDVETDKGIIIPTGTIVHGLVKFIENPKNLGRDG